jgi:formylglycine-generating enzyme required for sulfatase activity
MNQPDNPPPQPNSDLKQRLEQANARSNSRRITVVLASLVLLALGTGYFFFGSGVQVNVLPEEAQIDSVIELKKGMGFVFGNRVIALPGEVQVSVVAPGFKLSLVQTEAVSGGNVLDVVLERLPDLLKLAIAPDLSDVATFIDGIKVADGSSLEHQLSEGTYALSISHVLFKPYETELRILGGGNDVKLDVTLSPATQPLEIVTQPAGAQVFIDGSLVGTSPLSTAVLQGRREIKVTLDGFVDESRYVSVSLSEIPQLPTIKLSRNPGVLRVTSNPIGVSVLMDDEFRGNTPVSLRTTPDRRHSVRLSYPGYETVTRTLSLASGARESLSIVMPELTGKVEIESSPNADVFVNGSRVGITPIKLDLRAVKQEIMIAKQGYQPFVRTVVPDPLIRKSVATQLITNMDALIASAPNFIQSSNGHKFVLIKPGQIEMGAPRSEPGQRANEVPRKVNITRYFYVSTKEVTSNQFAIFQRTDSLGKNVELSDKPVANITWLDAARYANWVSTNDGLRPVYLMPGDGISGVDIDANGYRLPTESEWVWVSRYEAGRARRPLKFPWGQDMPVPADSGNFADESSVDETESFIPKYQDGMPRLAPVGSYAPNQMGIFDLGGNVSEWIHDLYELAALGPMRPEVDRLGARSGNQHVIRGASWRSSSLTELRLSYREAGSEPRDDVGLRLARWLGGRNGE